MQLRRVSSVAVLAWLAMCDGSVLAEGQVTIRGVYYREPSTRVVQPIVEMRKDLPRGFDVSAHYLLDAITSASIAAGVDTDALFTEFRNETGLGVGKTFGLHHVGVSYRYSAESDYWSHGLSLSGTRRVWGDTGLVGVSLGRAFDAAASRLRVPDCIARDGAGNPTESTCDLDVWFAGLSYSQVLSPTLLVAGSYETSYLDGFQANLYRMVGTRYEKVPDRRLRHALSARGAWYLPASSTGAQLAYRYYFDQYPGFSGDGFESDPWALAGHMIEGRLFQELSPTVEVRLSYRFYRQNKASFWCDFMARPDCYKSDAIIYTSDPKLGPSTSHMPELKLMWDARQLAGVPLLGWFAAGTFDVSYGYLVQSTVFGNAHLLQIGYALPI